jgi:hypothetical protein
VHPKIAEEMTKTQEKKKGKKSFKRLPEKAKKRKDEMNEFDVFEARREMEKPTFNTPSHIPEHLRLDN